MPLPTKNDAQARPGLIIALGTIVLLTLVAVIFIRPTPNDSGDSSGEGPHQVTESGVTPGAGDGSGMRLIQKTGAGNKNPDDPDEVEEMSFDDLDPEESFQKALTHPIATKRDQDLAALAHYLAQSNPELAVSMIQDAWKNSGPRNKGPVTHFTEEFASSYAKSNPLAASKLLVEMPAEIQMQYGAAVGAEWATIDATSATQWALNMGDPNFRNSIVNSIAGAVEKSATPTLIDSWANTIIQSPYAMEFSSQVARVWPVSNVSSTMQWLDTFQDPAHRASAYQEVATSLAGRDYRDAARWVAQFPEQFGIRDQAVDSVSYSWSKTEFEAAKAWAESMGRTLMNSEMPSEAIGTYTP